MPYQDDYLTDECDERAVYSFDGLDHDTACDLDGLVAYVCDDDDDN